MGMQYATSMGDWLSDLDDWHVWFTATFRPSFGDQFKRERFSRQGNGTLVWSHPTGGDNGLLSLPACRRQAVRMYREMRPTAFFWGTEAGSRNGRNHIHGLMKFGSRTKDAFCDEDGELFRYLQKTFGRAQVDKYDKDLGGAHYVSKYVAKELTDYDYFTKPIWKSS